MNVYRISNCRYIKDLSGEGAALYGGRWNNKKTHILYTAESRALSMLEALANIGTFTDMNYCIATIEIPPDSIQVFPFKDLPDDWMKNPPPTHLKVIGDYFIKARKYLALKVPSVLMEEEHNILLNPAHPDFKKVKTTDVRKITIDERLYNH